MQSFFDRKMSASWKVSLVISVVFLVAGVVDEYSLDAAEVVFYSFPLATWVTARWIKIGKEETDENTD